MFKVVDFSNWNVDKVRNLFGAGASEKTWLYIDGLSGIFKFPKTRTDGTITGEYYAEKLACEIGKLINIKCAEVDIGVFNGRIGSMSYNFIQDYALLIEGVSYIQNKFTSFNLLEFFDNSSGLSYSVELLKETNINIKDILKMAIFDCLIGNSDRHYSNWGYLVKNEKGKTFSPLYDNGSSLCAYVNENDIEDILKDKRRYNALIDTKSKSCLGWDIKSPIRHYELIKHIKDNYYKETIELVNIIEDNITEDNIKNLLSKFNNDLISEKRKLLLEKYIIDRRNKIIKIYKDVDYE